MTTITAIAGNLETLTDKYRATAETVDLQLAAVRQAMDTLAATFTGDTAGTFFAEFGQAQKFLATVAPLLRTAANSIVYYKEELQQTEESQQGLWSLMWEAITRLESYLPR